MSVKFAVIADPHYFSEKLGCSGKAYERRAGSDQKMLAPSRGCVLAAFEHIKNAEVDFSFLYLGYTDWAGHKYGWLSDEYMSALDNSWKNIARVVESLPEDYTVIITADHGGHDRTHGTELPEDMTIPMFYFGKQFHLRAVSHKNA